MNLLDTITERMAAKQLPLVAITVAAVHCPDTPVILTLHWHGFVEQKIVELEEAETVAYQSVPSSALQVNHRWSDLVMLDRAAMEAAWELGAWDVARAERPGCVRPGAESSEALECRQAFGSLTYALNGLPVIVAEAPDAAGLVNVAARQGYLRWLFRPVYRGIWADFADDATLSSDGTRTPPCPVAPVPPAGSGAGKTVYCFGRPTSTLFS